MLIKIMMQYIQDIVVYRRVSFSILKHSCNTTLYCLDLIGFLPTYEANWLDPLLFGNQISLMYLRI